MVPTTGTLNITDIATLGQAMAQIQSLQITLQSMVDSQLPTLSNNLMYSVNGSMVDHHLSNVGSWSTNLFGIITDLQTLHGHLSPIYTALSSSVTTAG